MKSDSKGLRVEIVFDMLSPELQLTSPLEDEKNGRRSNRSGQKQRFQTA